MRFAFVLAFVVMSGCYAPELAPCTVRCRLTFDCPSGMACGDDKFCHVNTNEAACPCIPLTCNDVAGACGAMPDTCGGTVQCGDCKSPLACGGGGLPNICGDPGQCQPLACEPGACGPSTDSCGNPRTCPGCPAGKKCDGGRCVPCTPKCAQGELACGDDGCGGTCGTCPDARWTCVPSSGTGSPGVCCIKNGQPCTPLTEGCNCCPGLFCISGFCTPAAGCSVATEDEQPPQHTGFDADIFRRTGEIVLLP
ncbi:MAG TPA: hypothetical protein VK427_04965 [Kofleriaceae bacterium]|nr:hypothetical protein [Kofleriaceae bacterium]